MFFIGHQQKNMLYQYSCLFSVIGIAGFVLHLSAFHHRDTDSEEQSCHGYRT